MGTREHGVHRFDHGAQYFTVREPRFAPWLLQGLGEGWIQEWKGTLVQIRGTEIEIAKVGDRFVGVPGMIEVPRRLAEGLDVRSGIRVDRVERVGTEWTFLAEGGKPLGRFDRTIVAVPAPQAKSFLAASPMLQRQASATQMTPCWAAMLAFSEPVDLPFDAAWITDGPLSWLARDSSKPGRPSGERWVVHASHRWSRLNLRLDPGIAADEIRQNLQRRFGPLPPTIFSRAHRWRYANPGSIRHGGPLLDTRVGLGVCGDWCVGGRVEGAMVSGTEVAEGLLADLGVTGTPPTRSRAG
jgi:predicted NAD/FAD-dependent oxidoreductase